MNAPTSHLRPRDLLLESVAALLSRPLRSVLTCLGTIMGVGTLVGVVGLTTTAQAQVSARFDALAATTVTVEDHHTKEQVLTPGNAAKVLNQVNGVTAVGYSWPISEVKVIQATPTARPVTSTRVTAVSSGLFDAVGAEISNGRVFDSFHEKAKLPVVVLGQLAADRLGITDVSTQPAILLDNRPFTVLGIIAETDRRPELLGEVLIPTETALTRYPEPEGGGNNAATMLITTRPGAAQQVAREAPWVIAPQDTSQVSVVPPPDPRSLRESVNRDLSTLLLILAGVCLFIGAVGIANTTLVAVMERVPEIGLRRSLGARPIHIFGQIITESAMLGTLGGLIGATVGIFVVLIVSLTQHWAPVMDPWLAILAPLLGLIVGAMAGLQPSWQASRIQPTEALRR